MVLFTNTIALIKGEFVTDTDILVGDDGVIASVGTSGSILPPNGTQIIDIAGKICAAGYIDIHTHGGNGHDLMESTIASLEAIAQYHYCTGTTTFCPTTLTAPIDETITALNVLREYKLRSGAARILGAHLEGPFISMKAPGAHPPQYILDPSPENTAWVWKNKDIVSRITLSPDSSGASYMTTACIDSNIQVSLGHDASIDDEIYALVSLGANSITHMTNCTSRPSRRTTPHKHLGLTEVGMIEDKLVCEIIADDRHVPNAMVKLLYKIKGASGIVLVSDSLSVAGMGKGEFYLGSGESRQLLLVDDGVATLPKLNTYAGSVTPISAMVVNCHRNIGIPLNKAISMGTLSAASVMNLNDRGDIQVSMLGDLNILSTDGTVLATYVGGTRSI